MEEPEKAKEMITKAEEYYPSDINIKMASLNIAKSEGVESNELIKNYFDIFETLKEQKESKKMMGILSNILEIIDGEIFKDYKEKITEMILD